MSALDALPGAVDALSTAVADMDADTAQLVLDMATVKARIPTTGRAASDFIWTTAIRDLIAAALPVVNQRAKPPIAGGLPMVGVPAPTVEEPSEEASAAVDSTGPWFDLLNISGAGVVSLLSVFKFASTGSSYTVEIVVDGAVAGTASPSSDSSAFWVSAGHITYNGSVRVLSHGGVTFPFDSSLVVRAKRLSGSSSTTFRCSYHVLRTG